MTEAFNALLDTLADEQRTLRAIALTELSDLSRSQLALFRATWGRFSAIRRRELLAAMVEQAEANIHLNFHVILRSCLDDTDAHIRKLAIEGLWEDEKVNLVPPLVNLLANDPDADVAAAAATSLGRYLLLGELGEILDAPAQQAHAALRAAWARFDAPVEVRRRALESLAYSADASVHEMIHSAYYDEDALLRQSALFAMGRSGDTRWGRFILAELDSPQPAMRFESAVAAGEVGLRQAVQPLIARLEDPDSSVREAAATALGKIGGPAARRALQALLTGPDEALSQAAEDALDELSFGNQRLTADSLDGEEPAGKQRSHARAEVQDEFADDDDFVLVDADEHLLDDEFDMDDDADDWDDEGWSDEDDQDWDEDDDEDEADWR